MPASLRCFTVLDSNVIGDILTDDPDNPSWGLVRENADGSIYLGGVIEAATLGQLVARLRRTGDVLIGAWPGDPWPEGLPPNPDYVGRVLEFVDRPGDDAALEVLSRQIPEGCVLRPMERELIEQSAQRDRTVQGFGSVDRFLIKGLGSTLMRGEEVLCEASAGPEVMGLREMGVFTYEPHRGRGYATATCAHLVRKIESAGLQTYWNCAKQNLASAAVARKLGYRLESEYKLLAWFESQ
jgi:GNAT superfamily N-acetyltransferase